ncbi:TUDOR [Nesidiocoris tenuis]|uniref:TUDOR n=1 Tax=Nesidiocoris tenuis TaxID=355587 RepID=A0ABN7AL71_9HEMI|nr:TUDOR [Nesidiocoris tenuis]
MEKLRPPDSLPKCCICKMSFVAQGIAKKERVPLILGCGHSSCENCILMYCYMNRPIVCDVCKKESPLPASTKDEDIKAQFPVCKYLLGIWAKKKKEALLSGDSKVGFVKKVKTTPEMSTEKSCQECGGSADCFCDSCAVPYCHGCFQRVHRAAKVFTNHKPVALAFASGPLSKLEEPVCEIHPDNKVDVFCKQCNVAICMSCLVCDHNGHTMQSIVDKNKELVEEIVASYARVSNLQQLMKASKKISFVSFHS